MRRNPPEKYVSEGFEILTTIEIQEYLLPGCLANRTELACRRENVRSQFRGGWRLQ